MKLYTKDVQLQKIKAFEQKFLFRKKHLKVLRLALRKLTVS